MQSSSQLAAILRETIRSVEQGTDISPDDPALLELKRIILLKASTLESEEIEAVVTSTPAVTVEQSGSSEPLPTAQLPLDSSEGEAKGPGRDDAQMSTA